MVSLQDRFYARKLMAEAERLLQEESFDFSKYQMLAAGIDRNLQDPEWVEWIYKQCAKRCAYFACVQQVAQRQSTA